MKVYLLPGIACDGRLFGRLDLGGLDTRALAWPSFPRGCTLTSIAEEMGRRVDASEPHVLVGVSMGGMVAQELAAITRPRKLVLISSWTGPHEWTMLAKAGSALRLYHGVNHLSMWATWPVKRILGQRDRATDRLLWEMACSESAAKVRTGLEAILRWKGSSWQGPVVRIHGDADRVIPLRFPVDHIVKGGSHIMVLTRAQEVSALLRVALSA